jgi:LIVCS family branched-chain amino acid:cation transporter
LSAAVVLACLTTAIGLVSACSEFIVALFKERLAYPVVTAGICVFSAFACNLGLTQIVGISAPILSLVYPTAMFLVVMRLIPLSDGMRRLVCRFGAVASFAASLCVLLVDTFGVQAFAFVHLLPLDEYGFGWLIPTFIAALIGSVIARMRIANAHES